MGRPAVFLDRDGTIVREVDYLRSVEELRLLPGAGNAIRHLNEAGLAVVVVSNQSGVARGLLTEADVTRIHDVLRRRLRRYKARLDGIYYCPHHPEGRVVRYRLRCRCRKPAPGLLQRAARDLGLDLHRCLAVGDAARDVEAGRRAGCRTVLVRTGYGAESESRWGSDPPPDHVADSLAAAVPWILREAAGSSGV
jgi:D-glycero-D-manno-heptose 1,7-bisphosphate phosphatase